MNNINSNPPYTISRNTHHQSIQNTQGRPQPLKNLHMNFIYQPSQSQTDWNSAKGKNDSLQNVNISDHQQENLSVSQAAEHRKKQVNQTFSPVMLHSHVQASFYSPVQDNKKKQTKKAMNPSSFKLNLLGKKNRVQQQGQVWKEQINRRKRSDSRSFTTPPLDNSPLIQELQWQMTTNSIQNNSQTNSNAKQFNFEDANSQKQKEDTKKGKQVKWDQEVIEVNRQQKTGFSKTFSFNGHRNKNHHRLNSSTVSSSYFTRLNTSDCHHGQSLNKNNNTKPIPHQTRPVSHKSREFNKENAYQLKKENNFHKQNVQVENVVGHTKLENAVGYPYIDINDFQIGQLLGRGGEATARMALHKQTGCVFCLRIIPRKKVEENLGKFINALKIQMYLNHPNIAKVYGLIVEKDKVYMIMEYCPDGNLADNLRQIRKSDQIRQIQLLKILSEGVQYMHRQKVQHRDLKLENILMVQGVPKICDFELAVHFKLQFLKRKTICGSPVYFSPEMIAKNKYNKKADIWCLGIIFYEILCGEFPFDIKDTQDFSQITSGNMKAFPEEMHPQGKLLLQAMLQVDSDERLDAELVVNHAFFKQNKWEQVEENEINE